MNITDIKYFVNKLEGRYLALYEVGGTYNTTFIVDNHVIATTSIIEHLLDLADTEEIKMDVYSNLIDFQIKGKWYRLMEVHNVLEC